MMTNSHPPVLPINDVVAAARKVGGRRLGRHPGLDETTRLDALGFDSLDLAELVITLEDIVGYELDPDSMAPAVTLGDLTAMRPLDQGRTT